MNAFFFILSRLYVQDFKNSSIFINYKMYVFFLKTRHQPTMKRQALNWNNLRSTGKICVFSRDESNKSICENSSNFCCCCENKIGSHEMQHYMVALQNYIYNQVIQVAWQELDKGLNEACSLNDLIETHLNYIKSSLAKYVVPGFFFVYSASTFSQLFIK